MVAAVRGPVQFGGDVGIIGFVAKQSVSPRGQAELRADNDDEEKEDDYNYCSHNNSNNNNSPNTQ